MKRQGPGPRGRQFGHGCYLCFFLDDSVPPGAGHGARSGRDSGNVQFYYASMATG